MFETTEPDRAPRYRIPPGSISAIRLLERTTKEISWSVAWSISLGALAWFLHPARTPTDGGLLFFVWPALIFFMARASRDICCAVVSRQCGMPVPQILIDKHGIAFVGLTSFKFHAWTNLSDVIVHIDKSADGDTYSLIAFLAGATVPEGAREQVKQAKLRFSIPNSSSHSAENEAAYRGLSNWINLWRAHVLADGPLPNRLRLQATAELMRVEALSDAELDETWRIICTKY